MDQMECLEAMVIGVSQEINDRVDAWESFAVAFDVDEDSNVGNSGFCWGEKRVPFAVDDNAVDEAVLAFRDLSRDREGNGWKAMLLQYVRSTRSVNTEFEFDNANRWRVTPKNMDTVLESMKP